MTTRKRHPKTIKNSPSDLTGADAIQYAFMGATGLTPQELPYGVHSGWYDDYKKTLAEHGFKVRTMNRAERIKKPTVLIWSIQGKLMAALHDKNGEVQNGTGYSASGFGILQRIEVTKLPKVTVKESATEEELLAEGVEQEDIDKALAEGVEEDDNAKQ